jgi:hypothetical protein|tara:strand:- start:427 stop:942 length:516 start_codon:yes stop_codon:yes gene_type:complete
MALGDVVRKFISENLDSELSNMERKTDKQVAANRSGGGSGDVEDSKKLLEDMNALEQLSVQIKDLNNTIAPLLSRSEAGRKAAEKLREANVIGSSLNPAAAALGIVQEKIMDKFKEEIEDLGSAAGIIKPALNKLDRALTNMRNKLNQSIKDKEQADSVKQERNKMLGKEE